jgi:DNA-binding SARP family transcriptional activator
MTDFRVLGPIEVVIDGERIGLPAGQPRALLARLLLDANRAVSSEALVDSIWGEAPPPSSRKVVQAYVSQLRKLLGAGRIETQTSGYAVRLQPGELDLARFEELTAAAETEVDPARRSTLLSEALSLWRGSPLAEFADEPFGPAAARRLNDLRISALEQRIEADLALGRHERVIDELETLVVDEPLREQPRRQLMLALYRSGRQAEALARYRDGRRRGIEAVGLEPSDALQELERAILRGDPDLHLTAQATAPRRGPVIATSALFVDLLAPLCTDGRELILVEPVTTSADLGPRSQELLRVRELVSSVPVRAAVFTSDNPANDLARLAAEQEAELLVVSDRALIPATPPCDVAFTRWPDRGFSGNAPVVVPFGGRREEWAALELAAWIARAHGLQLRLLGVDARQGERDASRMLASASLALQRFAETSAQPVLVAPGPEAILAQDSSVIVLSLPSGELDASRSRLLADATVPLLLVRAGLRPSGVAPDHTLTRFSWSLRDD